MTRFVRPELFEAWGAPVVVENVERLGLRWMLADGLGLPTVAFQVWGWVGPLPTTTLTLTSTSPLPGVRLLRWGGGRVVAVQLTVDVPAGQTAVFRAMTGPRGTGQVADLDTVPGPVTGRAVVLSASAIASVTVTGSASVATTASALAVGAVVDGAGWRLLDRVGLPADSRFAGTYSLDPQGAPGADQPPPDAAMQRVKGGLPDAGWSPVTDLGVAAPPYDTPDASTLVTQDLAGLLDAVAKLLAVEPDPAKHADTWVDVGMRAPSSIHGIEGAARWQSRAAGRVRPLGSLRLAAATDPAAALALGYGTTLDRRPKPAPGVVGPGVVGPGAVGPGGVASGAGAVAPSGVSIAAAAANPALQLFMVTVTHKIVVADVPVIGEIVADGDLTAFHLAVPPEPVELPAGVAVARTGLDRPAAVDRPWLEITEVSWASPPAVAAQRLVPPAYAVLRADGAGAPEALLEKRIAGGVEPFAASSPPDAEPAARVQFDDRGLPEAFPGEDPHVVYSVAAQDWFGRWSGWRSVDHTRSSVAPQVPAVSDVAVNAVGGPPGASSASVDVTWDWSNRTPASIAVRTRVVASGSSLTPGAGSILQVGGPVVADHVVDFSTATPDTPPAGPVEIAERRVGDLRTYTITVPGLVVDHALADRIDVLVSASAVERVRPAVQGAFSQPASTTLVSPVPPPAPFVPAPMVWASLPDPAGISRVTLTWAGSAPSYAVYAADETSVARELGLPSPDLDVPPAQRLVGLRSQDLAAARRAFRRVASAVTEPAHAVELPRGSQLIQLHAVVGVSAHGVESAFPAASNDFLAVATPAMLRAATPTLRAHGRAGAVDLEVEVSEALVEVDRVEVYRVADRLRSGTLEAAGAPGDPAPHGHGHQDRRRGAVVDRRRGSPARVANPLLPRRRLGRRGPGRRRRARPLRPDRRRGGRGARDARPRPDRPPGRGRRRAEPDAGQRRHVGAARAHPPRRPPGGDDRARPRRHRRRTACRAGRRPGRPRRPATGRRAGAVLAPSERPGAGAALLTGARRHARRDGRAGRPGTSYDATVLERAVINQQIATAAFDQSGLDAMGLASGQLAAQWGEVTPTFDAAAMTLTSGSPSQWHAPAGGMLHWSAFGAPELTDAEGQPIGGTVAVHRFHPQTVLRLRRLVGARYDGRTDGRAGRPVPVCAAIRDGDAPPALAGIAEDDPPLPPVAGAAGTPLTPGRLSFHDEQGLIVDPVAVACLFRDLMRGFPALRSAEGGAATDLESTGTPGAIGKVCALASGRRVHLVDLYGAPWVARPGGSGVRIGTGTSLDAGPHDWPDGQSLQPTSATGPVRFALSPQGSLATTAVAPPAFPATTVPAGSAAPVLDRQFLRVAVVDLDLHLVGHRAADEVLGVPAPDEATRREPAPVVREGGVDLLVDGQATLGAVTEVTALAGFRLAVSPELATDVAFPPDRTQRWPAQPPVTETALDLDGATAARARSDATAAYIGASADVVVTWPAGALPPQAHVRLFPRVDPGPARVPLAEIDFARRGDGGAGIATAAGLAVRVPDPFRVGSGPRPAGPDLMVDLLIVTRGPGGVQGRLFGGLTLPVVDGGTAPATPTVTNGLAALPDQQRGLGPSPLLGLPSTQAATGTDPVLALLDLATPREAARFRTMARTESVVVGHDGAAPGAWSGVLTAGFLSGRSVRDDARLGNPGHPAGPEEHASGLRVTGALAQDLARAALRRTHHLGTRLEELAETRWNDPAPATGTAFGAVLANVAETVDAPELAVLPTSVVNGLPDDWAQLVSQVSGLLPGSGLPATPPTPAAGDRWVKEVKRDAHAADHGRRDTQWALRTALSRARHLVYVESALFGETGAAGGTAEAVDLVALLRERLADQRDLKVVVALPKRVPFGPGYESFAQRHHVRRNTALAELAAVDEKRLRVIAYHPVGFPGRPETRRGSLVVVDDVWALVGSSTWSRRGLTFDGSIDVALLDRSLRDGRSAGVAELRRTAMARTLGVRPPVAGSAETPDPRWVQLAQPGPAYALMAQTLARGGDGLLEPLWPGLPESELPALDAAIADPDGREVGSVLQLFASVLADLGSSGV